MYYRLKFTQFKIQNQPWLEKSMVSLSIKFILLYGMIIQSVKTSKERRQGFSGDYYNYEDLAISEESVFLKQRKEFKSNANMVDLKFSAQDLPKIDGKYEPSTMVEVELVLKYGTPWQIQMPLRSTECVPIEGSPSWPEYIQFQFDMERAYTIHAVVYHCERQINSKSKLIEYKKSKRIVGELTIGFAVLLRNNGMEVIRPLMRGISRVYRDSKGDKTSTMTITAYELQDPQTLVVYFDMSIIVWGNAKGELGNDEYAIEISDASKSRDNIIYISELKKKSDKSKFFLKWKKVMLPMSRFIIIYPNNVTDTTRSVQYRIITFKLNRVKKLANKYKRYPIASFTQDFSKILFASDEDGEVNFGLDDGFVLQQVITRDQLTFPRLIYDGMKMNTVVAIDFARSNVAPGLHKGDVTQYELAIKSALKILVEYDSDNKFPFHIFGIQPQFKEVNHNFLVIDPVTWNRQCIGVAGVINGYKKLLRKCALETKDYTHPDFDKYQRYDFKLSSPTYFSYVIRSTTKQMKAANKRKNQPISYYFLLIVTNGEIEDEKQTIVEIVEASYYPMSIVIVGVGQPKSHKEGNFETMKKLDSDNHLLRDHTGRAALRDIVQFVRFNSCYDPKKPQDLTALSDAVLEEIPSQVASYFLEKQVFLRNPPPHELSRDKMKSQQQPNNAAKKPPSQPPVRIGAGPSNAANSPYDSPKLHRYHGSNEERGPQLDSPNLREIGCRRGPHEPHIRVPVHSKTGNKDKEKIDEGGRPNPRMTSTQPRYRAKTTKQI